MQSGPAAINKKVREFRSWAQVCEEPVAALDVASESLEGGSVERHQARFAELPVADGEEIFAPIDVCRLEIEHFADAHAAYRHQSADAVEGLGSKAAPPRAGKLLSRRVVLGRLEQATNLGLRVKVRAGRIRPGGQQVHRRHLGPGIPTDPIF